LTLSRRQMRKEKIGNFRRTVRAHYRKHRRDLLWRRTADPYKILVSEIMLQQTQADRVVEKYRTFLKHFPTITALAEASLRDVLLEWQGLGYNRRAVMLHRTARAVVAQHGGKVPRTVEELEALQGIGRNTACAIAAFAYNQPVVFIETNIRSVFLHHFFPAAALVSDKEVLELIAVTLDKKNPREWYWALMDYGTFLKKLHQNPSRRSAHYKRQSPFKGSDRELRGKITRLRLERPRISEKKLIELAGIDLARAQKIVEQLKKEGLFAV
jgi:A/G-specific adenine glycosylase